MWRLATGKTISPLLNAAGQAVAMGNSPDDLKEVADYITADIDHNGLAQAVRRYFFNESGVAELIGFRVVLKITGAISRFRPRYRPGELPRSTLPPADNLPARLANAKRGFKRHSRIGF